MTIRNISLLTDELINQVDRLRSSETKTAEENPKRTTPVEASEKIASEYVSDLGSMLRKHAEDLRALSRESNALTYNDVKSYINSLQGK